MLTRLLSHVLIEYMDHGSLYDLLHNETMVIEGEYILPILRDIAQGVRFLHAATPTVIHGDLKAQNILVDSKFRSKVADFGLSQKKRLGATGTPFWMAPELLRGETTNTTASDVYSFGIILYELYSRKDPYEGEDDEEVLRFIADPSVNKRPTVPASCPSEIKFLMAECVASQPEVRPTFKDLDLRLKSLEVSNVEPGETRFSMQSKKEKRTDTLLFDVFPQHIAAALRDGRKVEPEQRDMVTIFFSDIVGFTEISAELPAMKVSDLLDRLYNRFDELSRDHDVFKVETIGDAYMAVTNLSKDQSDHAKRIADFAVAAINAANETLIDPDNPDRGVVNIRVGFHSGSVVANVVGSRNPRYCLFGDTVNTASRMESNSLKNRIHCSEISAKLLQIQHPDMSICPRGRINVKGKGAMRTYWVNEKPSTLEEAPYVPRQTSARRIGATSGSKRQSSVRFLLDNFRPSSNGKVQLAEDDPRAGMAEARSNSSDCVFITQSQRSLKAVDEKVTLPARSLKAADQEAPLPTRPLKAVDKEAPLPTPPLQAVDEQNPLPTPTSRHNNFLEL
jgi:class 3 adenylate cyclase